MHPELIHLYGPFSINTFGFFIVMGLLVFSYLLLADPQRQSLISSDQYFNLLSVAIIAALVGGRALFVLANWNALDSFFDIIAIWNGGFFLLGSVLALLLVVPIIFYKMHLKVVPLLDLVCVYAPILQAISRIGCFFAGCCFGIPTTLAFGVINHNCFLDSLSHVPLHPTQLYSAFSLLMIFLLMYLYVQKQYKKSGQITCIYLLLISIERFFLDFLRADREFLFNFFLLSISQIIALAIAISALIAFLYSTYFKKAHS